MRPQAMRGGIALSDTRPIWRSLLIFLVPLMASNILQALGATANSIFLGRLIGVKALAAASVLFPVVFFLFSFLIGVASGSTVLIGQAYGARNEPKVKEAAGAAIALTLILGAVVGGLGAWLAAHLLGALGTPSDVAQQANAYARVTFISMPVLFVFIMYTTFLRGVGDTTTPFYALIGGTALTMVFTPALILGWLGLPRLGIDAAPISNALATTLTLAGLLIYLGRAHHPLAFDRAMLRNVRLRGAMVRQIVRIGVPTGLNLVMISLSEVAVIAFVNRFGSTATAAYGAVNQIASYVQFPAVSIGISVSIFGSQAIGAGRLERLPKVVRSGVALNYAIVGLLIAACYVLSRPIVAAFVTDAATVDIAERLLHITLWSYAIFGNARVIAAIMLSSGTVLWPTILSIASIWGVEVPVAYVLMQRIGLDGVWYGYPAAYLCGLAMQLTYYYAFWKRRPIKRLV